MTTSMTNTDTKVAPQGLNPLIADQNTIEQEASILAALTKAVYAMFAQDYAGARVAPPLTSIQNVSPDPTSASSPTATKPPATDVWVFAVDGKKGMVVNDELAAECRAYGFTIVRWFKIGTYRKSVEERSRMYGAWDEGVMASCYVMEKVRAERVVRRA